MTIGRLENRDECRVTGGKRYRKLDGRISAVVFEGERVHDTHLRRREPLRFYVSARMRAQRGELSSKRCQQIVRQFLFDCRLPERAHIGEAHAVRREHPRERMDVHPLHAQRIGHHAGMLPGSTAEAGERVFGYVIAALHADVLDCVGHVFHRDAQEACGDFLR